MTAVSSRLMAERQNNEVSAQLLAQAIANEKWRPSRCSHICIILKTAICEPFSVLHRILGLAADTIRLPCVLLCPHKKKLASLACHLITIAVLDPLYILAAVIKTVIRAASAVLGIISPAISAAGWALAEGIEYGVKTLEIGLRRKFELDNISREITSQKISPDYAVRYLGKETALKIWQTTPMLGDLPGAETMLRRDFCEYLTALNEGIPGLFETVLTTDYFQARHKNKMFDSTYFERFHFLSNLRPKCKDFDALINAIKNEKEPKEFSIEEIALLSEYLSSWFQKEHLLRGANDDPAAVSVQYGTLSAAEFCSQIRKLETVVEDAFEKIRDFGSIKHYQN